MDFKTEVKKLKHLKEFEEIVAANQNSSFTCPAWKVDEVRKELLNAIESLCQERIREIFKELETYLKPTCEREWIGDDFLHVDYMQLTTQQWQTFKSKYLNEVK